MKPIVGISCSYDYNGHGYNLAADYVQAIEAAGGLPVILPYLKNSFAIKELLKRIDALLLTGGGDVDPIFFGEEPFIGTGAISPARDIFEIELTSMAIDLAYPVLGICRGIQVLNIVAGGTIHQDLHLAVDMPLKHKQEAPSWYPTHQIGILPNTKLADILGVNEIRVNSFHHQSVAQVAPGFVVSAESHDGVIEAIENTQAKFLLGVQWHPEHLWMKNEKFLNLFTYFIRNVEIIPKQTP